MAVKKAPITSAWQVNLYCDHCGEIMTYRRYDYKKNDNKLLYVYGCDTCDHEEIVDKTYPHQIVLFDTSKMEVIG